MDHFELKVGAYRIIRYAGADQCICEGVDHKILSPEFEARS